MALVSEFPRHCPALVRPCYPKLPFGFRRCKAMGFNYSNAIWPVGRRIPNGRIQYLPAKQSSNKHILATGRGHYQFSYEEDLPEEPFWLSLIKEAIWALKSLFMFLAEQPSQLKYIEWPSFQSTLKTATLTLVIVSLLIVALSSVDSVLCYMLALLLRSRPR